MDTTLHADMLPVVRRSRFDRRQTLEEYLSTADVVKMEEIGLGVTRPRRAYLAPGGLVDRMAWKTIKPGFHSGYWESYKSEIAAYELDKLLGLDMIPPTVERQVRGDVGAAIMWVGPIKSFRDLGGPPSPPADKLTAWNRQIVRAKMFDNLICNIDPNLGNWLVDPSWNLILIDHTRSFTTKQDIVHEMTRVDRELWERMQALTVEELVPVVAKWIGNREIRAIIARRDRMQAVIDKLVAAKGEAAVFVSHVDSRPK
ncbi:MAG: hypothetical protein LC791_11120 [Acidobacteria bacterium]|nr:hypothetical protein [Acidobacteriota bacterium]